MKPVDYILNKLKALKQNPASIIEIKSQSDLVDFIYKAIMSKKFRKYSVSPEAETKVRTAIELNVKNNEPIKIAIPFGTYKLWRLEESPEVDWAELFAVIYYSHWLTPITQVYKPGAWFDFCGDDAILELMNNIPEEDTEKYKQSLRAMLKFIEPYLPENLKFTFSPVGERYSSKQEFLDDLNQKAEELRKKGPISLADRQIEMIEFNIKPNGKEINYQENRLLHDAYMDVSKRRPYHKRPDKILISATPFGDRTSLPLGTTKTSVVKYQTGAGILKKKDDTFIEYIYSPSQIESAQFEWESVDLPGLVGKNFKKIRVVLAMTDMPQNIR